MNNQLQFHAFLRASLRRSLAVLVLLGWCIGAIAQTCALPGWDGPVVASGIINAYHGSSGSTAAGVTSITVASATGLRTNTRALKVGDLIIIMQMQDSVNGANTGLHEYAQITSLSGTSVGLNRPLTNAYNNQISTSSPYVLRNWQVIWVPQYSAATVSGTVNSDRWTINPGTGVATGGVVAMDVAGSLALNGTVTVAGAGFRGAMGLQGVANSTNTPTTTNSNFDPATIFGGQKGEGIQGTPPVVFTGVVAPTTYTALLSQGYALGAAGQTAIGNGGGGSNNGLNGDANNYNAGGGGGSNAGAGGQGGNSWNSNGLAANLNSNQTTTQTGNVAGGKGGNAQVNSATRLVLGGGGGSGAANNASADTLTAWPPTGVSTGTSSVANGATGAITSSGSSGGGVVLIRAGTLSSTAGAIIDATGYLAYNKNSGDTDSGGGGGAGGSVFIVAGSGTGANLTVNATGGSGGSSSYYNHGPGGGGGGGYVLSNLSALTVNLIGGSNGYDGCCGGTTGNGSPKAWNSTAGSAGSNFSAGGTAAGVQGGAACLPVITVTKSTSTPTITVATGATASYSVNMSNSGGAASNVFLLDATLPPGWIYSTAATPTPTFSYKPAPPQWPTRLLPVQTVHPHPHQARCL